MLIVIHVIFGDECVRCFLNKTLIHKIEFLKLKIHDFN